MNPNRIAQVVVACFVTLFVISSQAQGIYFNIGAGYGLPVAPNIFSASDNNSTSNGSVTIRNYKLKKGGSSLGSGVQASATVGYMFAENIGVEMGIGYLVRGEATSKAQYAASNGISTYERTISRSMIRFTPALRISSGKRNVKPYVRTGLVVGVRTKLKVSNTSNEPNNGVSIFSENEREFSGGISLGFACGVGVTCKVSNHIGMYAEMGVITQSWAPKKSTLTKSVVDGVDQLPNMKISDKETEYVTSYTDTYPNTNTSSPSKSLKMNMPFSSAGINVGVHISLEKKK